MLYAFAGKPEGFQFHCSLNPDIVPSPFPSRKPHCSHSIVCKKDKFGDGGGPVERIPQA
jgi:hypothetical protein